ncbi:MAG: DUF1858 domain-containing protein [Acidobacteriota bacterium]
MKLRIDPDTTVGALLEAYPEAETVLIELAPAFAKLRNPVVRRTVARIATLEQAAKIGGISLRTMIEKLRISTGECGVDVQGPSIGDEPGEVPAWVTGGRVVEEVDAEGMLARGIHPIGKVREAVAALGPGELVLLRAPFRPQPLIDTMRRAGAQAYCVPDGRSHVTYFARAL